MASRNAVQGRPSGGKGRPWQGLHVRPLNVEKGTERFSPYVFYHDSHTNGYLKYLLCDATEQRIHILLKLQHGGTIWYYSSVDSLMLITLLANVKKIALSQRRNLLFVSYNHQIYVWEPAGSFQILGSKPEMIITPVMKNPQSHGYIAPHYPHAVNSILVDDLGREEILLLATDSGNVTGYRVEAIYSALKRAAKSNQPRPLDGSQVDPFFIEYVEASAWGLAIHKFARLIAVTANTGLITVFAFALVNPTSEKRRDSSSLFNEDDDFSDYGQTWLHINNGTQFAQLQQLMPDKHRTRNIKLTYTGHFTNIPSVSFLNCDLDPNGAWMVSTDIDNKLLVWKVWERLGPFNVYHFNDIGYKSFMEAFHSHNESGWAVIALDPRSFHPLKFKEDACGGLPQPFMNNDGTVLDLTGLASRIPNASQLYNYFPPAVKIQPEQPVLPDIFGSDCRISTKKNPTSGNRPNTDNGMPQDIGDPAKGASVNPPSNLTNASSHRAVDSSAPEDNMSEDGDSNPDVNLGADQQGIDHDEPQTHDSPQPGHGPLSTAEFLRFALFEALGGDTPVPEGYYDDYSEDEDMGDTDDNYSDGEERPENRARAYQVFDRMLRSAFPEDPMHYEQRERLMPHPPAPAPICSRFPILQFSQTDIRLVPDPTAPHASVVCGAPLRQPFTHPIVSIRASDRFNMVKYIPEHGIVVAASQKGRAAVISLTESEDTGVMFRVDWIVPFESQERYGDRPLIPLLGMTVSPIQGFEMPPDVSYIPRGVSEDEEVTFHYRFVDQDDADNPHPPKTAFHHAEKSNTETDSDSEEESDGKRVSQLTLPECHAKASRVYKPEESWRGWYPSRRYRLLLLYADHTVMSYEFWYDWKSPGAAAVGEESDDGYPVV